MPKVVTLKVKEIAEREMDVRFPAYRVIPDMGEDGESASYWKIDEDGTYTVISKSLVFKHYMTEPEVRYEIHRCLETRGNLESISQDPEFWLANGKHASKRGMFWAIFQEAVNVVESQFPEEKL